MSSPGGRVTILFTDVEGSTRLARACGERWPVVVADHHRLVGGAIERHGGHVEGTAGDSFFATFADGPAAAHAAVEAQRALAGHDWPAEVGDLRVRMGIHTGTIERSDNGVTGLDIHLAARVEAAAHGGQVVTTAPAHAAIGDDFELASLGDHRLKDFPQPERLFLLVHDGRRADEFPPLRTDPVRPTNLQAETRPLIGRERELGELRELFVEQGHQLVTLLGLGGTGKTRLALAAAVDLLSDHEGGVWFTPFAGVTDPASLLPAIASELAVKDESADSLEQALVERLSARPTLLVLDNLEQIVDAAPALASLMDRAPALRVLATSQLPLRVRQEHPFRLDPLPSDDAVELFGVRARAALAGFDVDEHREAVAELCTRLDGVPLAVELAAARIEVIAPRDLIAQLDRSLGVLARGPRDLDERHRSLRNTLEWTFDLLDPDEQVLLARMAAFAGSVPLDAVEAVAGSPPGLPAVDALDGLAGLVDASLVRREETREHGVRFGLPHAVTTFAREKLTERSEETAVFAAHGAHVAAQAERCRFWYPGHTDAARARVLALQDEQRPALTWSRANDPDLHMRLTAALGALMARTDRPHESQVEIDVVLAGRPLTGQVMGWLALLRAWTSFTTGGADDVREPVEEALAVLRDGDDDQLLEMGLRAAAAMIQFSGSPERGLELMSEALALARRGNDPAMLCVELTFSAQMLMDVGRLEEADRHLDEAEQVERSAGDSSLPGQISTVRADIAGLRGDWPVAARCFAASAEAADRLRSYEQVLGDLAGVAMALARLELAESTVEVLGMMAAIEEESGNRFLWPPESMARFEEATAAARSLLSEQQAADATERGRAVPASQRAARAADLAAQC